MTSHRPPAAPGATPTILSTPHLPSTCRSLAELFAGDPECAAAAGKGKGDKGRAGLARTHAFAGAGLDDELELRKLQVGRCFLMLT